jgi:hypothetical protein
MYLQKSANLSRGGIYLERTVPHPEGTLLNLRFTLPDDSSPIECKGRIVYPRADETFGMGLEFCELDEQSASRIDEFLTATQVALPDEQRAGEADESGEPDGEGA